MVGFNLLLIKFFLAHLSLIFLFSPVFFCSAHGIDGEVIRMVKVSVGILFRTVGNIFSRVPFNSLVHTQMVLRNIIIGNTIFS